MPSTRRRPRLHPRSAAGKFVPHSEPGLKLRPLASAPVAHAKGLMVPLSESLAVPGDRLAAVIPPGDNRQPVAQPTVLPWCAHVRLLMTGPDDARLIGSGWLIGPRTIITAGHCVYDGGWMKQIMVTPAGDEADFPTVPAVYYTATDAWVNGTDDDARQKADLGMVSVADPIAGVPGPLSFAVYDDDQLERLRTQEPDRLTVAGFPVIPYGEFLVERGNLLSYNPPFLEYDVDTSKGQSGGPVLHWVTDDAPVVIGVHHFNVQISPPINRAIRIGPAAAALLQAWAKQ